MKKDQLMELGLSEETAKEVLKINGSNIEGAKVPLLARATVAEDERDSLRRLVEAQTTAIKGLEGVEPASQEGEPLNVQSAPMKEAEKAQPEAGITPKEERTFSQEDVNRIVQERLAKERAKHTPPESPLAKREQALAEREKELEQREFIHQAQNLLSKKKWPVEILDALNASSIEALQQSIALLDEHLTINPPHQAIVLPAANPVKPVSVDLEMRRIMGLK